MFGICLLESGLFHSILYFLNPSIYLEIDTYTNQFLHPRLKKHLEGVERLQEPEDNEYLLRDCAFKISQGRYTNDSLMIWLPKQDLLIMSTTDIPTGMGKIS